MGRINVSVSVPDKFLPYLEDMKAKNINFSSKVVELLEAYWTGKTDDGSLFDARYEILKKQTEKLKEEVAAQWEAIHAAMSDHGAASEKRISEKEKKEDQIIDRLEKEFSDIPISDGVHQYRAWARSQKLEGADPQGILKHRIAFVAEMTGASRADVMEIMKREYPGIMDLLEADHGVL